LGVGESLARSFDMMKHHFAWDIAIMWLLVIGLNIGWIIATIIVGFLLFVVSLMIAVIPALVLGGLSSLVLGWGGIVVGILVAGLIIAILMVVTTTFLQGLRMTFLSTLWTLTYRELLAIEGLNDKEAELWEAEYKEEEDSHELQ
jgi:hypothetical protein